ncbi:ferrochelatase [Sanyastnella coralliicola]|uniref:ferrochelatase n=1 Tax=Sanyastnella coralliicola TaxID=3069118 RepID=UPI0027B9D77E|nr:ferrochelatase [Longitalea sp. SCSIO 12813]
MKTGILLINLGTPDAPTPGAVGRYLTEFLGDGRVIDIPWLPRKILVNGIISPTRRFKSSAEYKKVWTDAGSPLLLYSQELTKKLQTRFEGEDVTVELAMRYQSPSMDSVMARMEKANYDRIIIVPLYAQYASATTGSTIEKAFKIISKWYVIPEITAVSQYWDDDMYINGFVTRAQKFDLESYDHFLFSYHGLPERQVDKVYEDRQCSNHSCEDEINEENKFCYKATCYATTRAIAERLGIKEEDYTVCFQSRLDSKWLRPFADEVVEEQAEKGAKRLLVFSPAFVADCLETLIEIGEEYDKDFQEAGGEKLDLVPSLNADDDWVDALESLARKRMV